MSHEQEWTAIARAANPAAEAAELEELARELERLEAELAEREAFLAARRGELRAFDARYRSVVGLRFAELDKLEADIAEALADLSPHNEALRERARELRAKADESAAALGEELPDDPAGAGFAPSDELRKLYRRVALAMHPDLCSNENEIQIRHELMVEANRAYSSGDQQWLEALLSGTAEPRGAGVSGEIVWAKMRVALARQRLDVIERDLQAIERSELFRLWRAVEAASSEEHDALRDLASSLDRSIRRAQNRHEVLAAAVADPKS